jgi:hypothetical protein
VKKGAISGFRGPRTRKRGHAVAILDATVRSLSNFSLFRLKACCRQSSRLLHAWCSGNRCCVRKSQSTLERVYRCGTNTARGKTYSATKVRATMRAVANDAQSGLIALLLAVELATLLSRHVFLKMFLCGGRKIGGKFRKRSLERELSYREIFVSFGTKGNDGNG